MNRRHFIIACSATVPFPAWSEDNITTLPRHWFTLTWPKGFRLARLLDNGYRFNETGDLRSPMIIEVTVSLADHDPVVATWDKRPVDGFSTPFCYQFRTDEGGSGGTDYILKAKGYDNEGLPVTLQARKQSELGAPDFTIAWQTLATYQIQ